MQQQYLLNTKKRKSKAHFWNGKDTACKMWSTGGMNQRRDGYVILTDHHGKEICNMCRINEGTPNE